MSHASEIAEIAVPSTATPAAEAPPAAPAPSTKHVETMGGHEGMWDAEGRFVPVKLIKPVDLMRHDLVMDMVAPAKALSSALSAFKREALDDVQAFLELSAERYGTTFGGGKGNVSLFSFDGRYKVERTMADQLVFDERLQVAKRLVDECVRDWGASSGPEIQVLLDDAFQVDRAGKISARRVLRLRQLDITDPKWLQAMQAISDSVRVASTKSYVRFYERVADSETFRPILLDFAAVEAVATDDEPAEQSAQ